MYDNIKNNLRINNAIESPKGINNSYKFILY